MCACTVVVLALALLLLKLEGDTADGSLLDALHEVGGETSDLVAEALRGDDGNLIADLLVGVAVSIARQPTVRNGQGERGERELTSQGSSEGSTSR